MKIIPDKVAKCFDFSSLRVRLRILVWVAIIPMALLVVFENMLDSSRKEAEIRESVVRLVNLAAGGFEQHVNNTKQALFILSHTDVIQKGESASITAFLSDMREHYPEYVNFGAADLQGNVFASAVRMKEPVNIADRFWFQQTLKSSAFTVGEYQIGRITELEVIVFGQPVFDGTGKMKFILFAAMDIKWLNRIWENIKLLPDSTFTATDRNGVILFRYPLVNGWIGKNMAHVQIVSAMLTKGKGLTDAGGLDDKNRIYAFTMTNTPGSNIHMAVGVSKKMALMPINNMLAISFIVLALVTALGILLARVYSNRFILKPINALRDATERFLQGDYSSRANLKDSENEIVRYANVFDKMAETIEQEITTRKQAEEKLSREICVNTAIADISNIFLSSESMSLEEISHLVLKHAREITGSKFGYVGYIHPDTGYFISPTLTRDIWDVCKVDGKSAVFKEFTGMWGWVLLNKKPLMTNAPAKDPRAKGTPPGHVPIHRFLSVPALVGGKLVGQISLANSDHDYTERDLQIAESLAAFYAIAVQRKRSEDALRTSEERYRELYENVPTMNFTIDASGTVLLANNTAIEQLGYTLEELSGQSVLKVVYEDDRPAVLEQLNACLQSPGRAFTWDLRKVRRDGGILWVREVARTMQGADGNTVILIACQDITERKKTEELIKNILESVDEGFIIIDRDFRIISANRAYVEMVKMPLEDILGKHCYEVSHHFFKPCYEEAEHPHPCTVHHLFETGEPSTATHTHYDKEGNPVYLETKAYALSKDETGKVLTAIEIVTDITEKRKLEWQLRQAQKMEAVGQLAGGIAHDFNNILTAIIGYSSILMKKLREDDPNRHMAQMVLESGERAANLTRSLLAFSREQILLLKTVDINGVIRKLERLLQRVIGEDVDFRTKLSDMEFAVMADAAQMEQALMNLATNARDAMPEGGALTISTELTELDKRFMDAHGYGKPGRYALISVSDTGMGMDEETRRRIFEPFFTTKELGKGTGLGLSIVYGIVKQHDGFINVYSEPGKGTTFRIYLPITKERVAKEIPVVRAEETGGAETILVAEDDETVRTFTRTVLEGSGYTVIEAVDGEDAVNKFKEHKESIDLLLFDVIMPKMDGKTAYDRIRELRPGVKALFTSGYTREHVAKRGVLEKGTEFIYKPASPNALLEKVREVLGK